MQDLKSDIVLTTNFRLFIGFTFLSFVHCLPSLLTDDESSNFGVFYIKNIVVLTIMLKNAFENWFGLNNILFSIFHSILLYSTGFDKKLRAYVNHLLKKYIAA